jgi:flagellar protein FlaG
MTIRSIDPTAGFDPTRTANSAAANVKKTQRPPAPTAEPEPVTAATQAPAEKPPEAPHPTAAEMRFHVDQDTGKTVVSFVDPENGQVIRQFPSSEALEVAKAIGKFQGMFVNLKV